MTTHAFPQLQIMKDRRPSLTLIYVHTCRCYFLEIHSAIKITGHLDFQNIWLSHLRTIDDFIFVRKDKVSSPVR